ncbi:MAG: protein kinase [Candidatus Latescibacterota bacterium]|nr:MAG: protein kinase [Candidatus Latescibacterota bacterium]
MIGQTISHYKITEKLGEGGMGVVYKAVDTTLDRPVALKFLPPELTRDPDAKRRFVHEAKAASALQHHNICTIHEIGETDDGRMFISMDCYEGETLKTRIARGPLPVHEAIDVVSQVTEGLAKAHEAGMVHRDMKPANVVITSDGVVKILDFGLAKLAGQTKVTKTGTTVGTVAYMSPEQASGKDVDYRSDVFSLGAVLYEMLAGEPPFKGDHEAAVLYGIMHNDPEPLARYRSDVTEDLQRIVRRALRKEPEGRYQNASEIAADLRLYRKRDSTTGNAGATVKNLRRRVVTIAAISMAAVIALYLVYSHYLSSDRSETISGRKMVAVLPFENLGPPEDEYFADGITEEITARLAGVHELGVIARTSAIQYKNTDKSIRQIGEELGVGYVLEGTIRWQRSSQDPSRIRVTPQLIKVSDATHVWAEIYEEPMTEVFRVQSNIAERVVESLDIALVEREREVLEAKPTENLEAYQAYLRGLDYAWERNTTKENTQMAIQMFERAVELDREFALGYAALSEQHSLMNHYGYDRSEERLSRAKKALDRALELNSELPEAHLAFAYYHYWGYRAYDRALEELAIAARGLPPNDGRLLEATAYIWRRQGKFEAAVDYLKKALEMSPRDAQIASEIGGTYRMLRKYAEADRYYDLAISLQPDERSAYTNKASNYIRWLGDTKRARDILEKMPGTNHDVQRASLSLWWYERDYEAIVDFLPSVSEPIWWGQSYITPVIFVAARAYERMGEPEFAHASYDSARTILEKELSARPDDPRIHASLGRVYAGLGRKDDAIREGKRAVELFPVSKDAHGGPTFVSNLAAIYVKVGEYDAALDQIEYVLSIPALYSIQSLRLSPTWDPLRNHPRYQALLEKYSADDS